MKFNNLFRDPYCKVFVIISLLIGFSMAFLSQSYGPLEDNRIHQEHGVRILNYYKGIDDKAKLSPFDDNGNYIDIAISQDHEDRGMNGFGGFFDLLTNFLHQFFGSIETYKFKSLINSLFGFLLFLFCGLLGKELGGWKAGLLALIFAVLCPVFFGYSMNNPKDIPAAAFYMFSLYHIIKLLKELPVITIKRAFFIILNISLLINIRVIGLIFIGYVLLAVFLWWVLENYKTKFKQVVVKDTLLLGSKIIIICIASYLAASIFWPYASTNPFKAPVELLFKLKDFRGFENLQLFEGVWKSSFDMPWYYAIKNLLIIMMPLHVFIGFFLIPLLFYKKPIKDLLLLFMVLFVTIFPLFILAIGKPNSHDGSRQFIFLVMPIVVVSTLGWLKMFELISSKAIAKPVYVVLGLLLLQPLVFMIRYHPMQALYFSPIIGGVSGAYGNYEIDYYGVAIKPALDWLEKNLGDENDPPKIRMYYGSQTKVTYFLNHTKKLDYALTRRESPNWDYSIIMLAEGKYKKDHINVNWSPENTVHEITLDGVAICYIVKNDYQIDNHIEKLKERLIASPFVQGYIELSLLYYRKQLYIESIEASNKVITLAPNNHIAYNNICSAYNKLGMYDKGKEACEKSLSINSKSPLAKNNLQVSLKGLDTVKNRELSIEEYSNLSYYYYKLGFYNRCIEVSKELLKIDPKNINAYNNICASYNQLKEWELGAGACRKALNINPDFERAKNNLNWAIQALKEQ